MKLNYMILVSFFMIISTFSFSTANNTDNAKDIIFPRSLDNYHDEELPSLGSLLWHRIKQEPFNLIGSLIFLFAIVHTFLAGKFKAIAHKLEKKYELDSTSGNVSKSHFLFGTQIIHFLGEVETIFGIWAIVLFTSLALFFDLHTAINYIAHDVNYTEPMFVVAIMVLAATRPIIKLSEFLMQKVATFFGGTLSAWWMTILTIGPLLGSFITEPAAMTISALLLAKKFYDLEPSNNFKYATIGLLFVNVSVGGTLTHFAAPPVLMVATPWHWDFGFMISHFGWEASIGVLISNSLYFFIFRKELTLLQGKYRITQLKEQIQNKYLKRSIFKTELEKMEHILTFKELGFTEEILKKYEEIKKVIKATFDRKLEKEELDKELLDEAFDQRFEELKLAEMRKKLPGLLPPEKRPLFIDPQWDQRDDSVPAWITVVHVLLIGWTVFNAHHPALFIAGLLFFLGFAQATAPFQNRIYLQPAIMVGFFLAGLVIHGGVQGWWIEPVLSRLSEIPLMLGSTILTAFNDNAAITYLSTLVPNFSDSLKIAVVSGAVTGGGLTIIANAPNPAGQSILKKYFKNGVSPVGLLKAAITPTIIMFLCFVLLKFY